ncbi:MAG: ABC transporter substrate-binding protein [Chloroflexota bacterium]|nr:ABC transporter substrate-binding protein [Chloroflexota bacterium]
MKAANLRATVIVVTGLVLAACGGGAAAPASSAPPATSSQAPAASSSTAPSPAASSAAASSSRAAASSSGAASAANLASDTGVTKDTITIGGTDPLSGPAAAYGTIPKASDAYFHYVNDNGGVNGRKINYKFLDDAYNPAQTVPLTKQLVEQDQVFLMFGGLGTQAQTSVRDYLNSKKVPQVFVATGATTFSAEFKKHPYTFGWQPVYQGESLIYARHLLQNNPAAKIAVIYQNDDYGQDYLDGLTKGLGSKANMIVGKENNDAGAADLTSQILKLKNSGADTLFIFETPSPAIKALVTTFKTGWTPTIYFNSVSNPVPYMQAAQKAAGDTKAVQGILTTLYTKDPVDPTQSSQPGMQLYKQIMSKYYPDGKPEDGFNIYGMATAYSLVDVLKKAGPNLTRQAVMDALNNWSEPNNPFLYPGIVAKNSPTDHYTITQAYLAKYDPAANDWAPVSQPVDVRGEIKFP